MPCTSRTLDIPAPSRDWQNAMGTVEVSAERYLEPTSLRDLVTILGRAELRNHHVHAVGAGYSLEDIATTPDWMVSLKKLNRVIDTFVGPDYVSPAITNQWTDRLNGSNDRLVHVEAGIRLFDLCQVLDGYAESLSLPTMGGSHGQHLAGAFSTSTHGSDINQPPLCDLVQAVHLVTTRGQEMWIESASEPLTNDDSALREALNARNPENQACHDLKIVRDNDLLNAVIVGMGRFGIIYAVVLQVTTGFHLAEYSQELSWPAVAAALQNGIGRDNPLEVIERDLLDPPRDGLRHRDDTARHRYLDIIFNTRNSQICWVRRRWKTQHTDALNVQPTSQPFCHKGVANGALAATAAGLGVYAAHVGALPIPDTPVPIPNHLTPRWKVIEINNRIAALQAMATDPHITGGRALAAILNAIWDSLFMDEMFNLSALLEEVTMMIFKGELFPDNSEVEGRRGRNWVLSAGSEDPAGEGDCFAGNSIEIIFGLETAAYLDFLKAVVERMEDYRQSGWLSVRFTRRSRALMSMHNVNHSLACSIEITSLKDLADNDVWMEWIEQKALELGGRPHWGQQNNLNESQVKQLYGEQLLRWRRQLRRVVGGSNTFSNNYTRQRGLEPVLPDAPEDGEWLEPVLQTMMVPDAIEKWLEPVLQTMMS